MKVYSLDQINQAAQDSEKGGAIKPVIRLSGGVSGAGNSMSQITNLAFFRARRGQSEALGAALAALVEPTRLEADCLNYDLHRPVDDADVWLLYENWRSPEVWMPTRCLNTCRHF
jgi:hypothetical protein